MLFHDDSGRSRLAATQIRILSCHGSRAAIQLGAAVKMGAPLSNQLLFMIRSGIETAAAIFARASTDLRSPFVDAHECPRLVIRYIA